MMFRRKARQVPDMQVVDNHLVVTPSVAQHDETVARLTVRADMILDELDGVIQKMSTLLKDSAK